jgi:hypothetical protein
MSSWANIRIPRKRDISQIPVELRPNIVPRVQQPQVILSESFQGVIDNYEYSNQIINPVEKLISKREPPVNPREYISKKIEIVPSPGAIELSFNNKSYVFVILRHLRTPKDNDLWITCYNSIRKFYSNKIVIIDDNSQVNTVNGKLYNAEILQSDFGGAGEILPYYYFMKYQWTDTMIFLHDSMFLSRRFRDEELDHSVRFHWYFVPNTSDDKRKITSYLSLLHNNKSLIEFYQNPVNDWKGCFGGAMIIDYETVKLLEDKYNVFTTLVMAIKTRKERESFERILGILMYHDEYLHDKNKSNFGNIFNYPLTFESNITNSDTALHNVKQYNYDTAIVKMWRGR